MKSLRFPPSFVRFAMVGVINTLAGLTVIYALKWLLDMNDVLANVIGYVAGLSISFILNGRWTFSFGGSLISRILPFVGVVLVAYLLNVSVVMAAIHWLEINSYLAQALGIVPYALISYFGSKHFVFTHTQRKSSYETLHRRAVL